jgi:hypothetical protein
MGKRVPLSHRRAQDQIHGVDALFEETTVSKPAVPSPAPPSSEPARSRPKPVDKKQPVKEKLVQPAKVTLYIREDQVLAIEKIQVKERERTGQKKDKSELVQEALDLLIKKYS